MSELTMRPNEAIISVAPNWTQSTGNNVDMWRRIDNGVLTPNDGEWIHALAAGTGTAFKFNPLTSPASGVTYTRIRIGIRHSGSFVTATPGIKWQLWTDYPTTDARMIAEQDIDHDTSGAIVNVSIIFDGVSVSADEFAELKVIPITQPAGPEDDGPEPHEPPA